MEKNTNEIKLIQYIADNINNIRREPHNFLKNFEIINLAFKHLNKNSSESEIEKIIKFLKFQNPIKENLIYSNGLSYAASLQLDIFSSSTENELNPLTKCNTNSLSKNVEKFCSNFTNIFQISLRFQFTKQL